MQDLFVMNKVEAEYQSIHIFSSLNCNFFLDLINIYFPAEINSPFLI